MSSTQKKRPLIGVLVGKGLIKGFKDQRPFYRFLKLHKASNKAKVKLFFFTVDMVNFNTEKIEGYYYDGEDNHWKMKRFSIPEAIYRRAGDRGEKNFDKLQRLFTKYDVKKINYQENFNKLEVHQHLAKFKDINQHLPYTSMISISKLRRALNRFPSVYIKAHKGGRGKQVARVQQIKNGSYYMSYYNHKVHKEHINSFPELLMKLKQFFKHKELLIQEEINLLTLNNQRIDLRAEVQRNGMNEVEVIGVCVRVGQKNSPITTHSNSESLRRFFTNKLNYSFEDVKQLEEITHSFVRNIFHRIEQVYGSTGELGIDIGLDKRGKLWYIECNSLSTKVSLSEGYGESTVDKAYLKLLQYGNFLIQNGRGNHAEKN